MPRRAASRARQCRPPEVETVVSAPPEIVARCEQAGISIVEFERLLKTRVERQAARARADGAAFFSFVIKAERAPASTPGQIEEALRTSASVGPKTHRGRRLECLPHQRVLFSFVEAHPRCVLRMPAGSSKTYCLLSEAIRALGQDPRSCGAIISATQAGAARPLAMVRDYVENKDDQFPELRLVYPELRPSARLGDPWTQEKLVVDRPAGIRDPSLVALGIDAGSLPGTRLRWILVDDLVNEENSRTPERRKAVMGWFFSTVLSRDDIGDARIVVANTPWVDGGEIPDLTFVLERAGWPTLSMDVLGNVWVTNADPGWDTPDLRPSDRHDPAVLARRDGTTERVGFSRLAAHDSPVFAAHGATRADDDESGATWRDADEVVPLWPEKWPKAWIDERRREFAGQIHRFNQLYLCLCTDEDEAPCKPEWVEACKRQGLEREHLGPVQAYEGPDLVVTGVDLGFGVNRRSDKTAFFTFQSLPDGKRKILDVETGRWTGDQIVAKVVDKQERYRSIVRVETNGGATFLRQWVLDRNKSIPIRAHYTTAQNKGHPVFGIASIFLAFANGAWIVPVDRKGSVDPYVQKWLDACVYYQPPPAHTSDVLIACWLACEQEREINKGRPRDLAGGGSLTAGLTAR